VGRTPWALRPRLACGLEGPVTHDAASSPGRHLQDGGYWPRHVANWALRGRDRCFRPRAPLGGLHAYCRRLDWHCQKSEKGAKRGPGGGRRASWGARWRCRQRWMLRPPGAVGAPCQPGAGIAAPLPGLSRPTTMCGAHEARARSRQPSTSRATWSHSHPRCKRCPDLALPWGPALLRVRPLQ
jgi:hypothetical protein